MLYPVSADALQRFRLMLDTPPMREMSVAEQRYQPVLGVLSEGRAAFPRDRADQAAIPISRCGSRAQVTRLSGWHLVATFAATRKEFLGHNGRPRSLLSRPNLWPPITFHEGPNCRLLPDSSRGLARRQASAYGLAFDQLVGCADRDSHRLRLCGLGHSHRQYAILEMRVDGR